MTEGLRIIRLEAANFKRLVAVEIEPDGNVVTISGKNGMGKTSVLDAIFDTLAGADKKRTPMPIREGETEARVEVDLGDFTVVRTWKGDKTTVTVTSKDGAKYGSPQAFLDEKLGALSFDPLAFSAQEDKKQLATLLSLVDLPFDPAVLAGQRLAIFDKRTELGREVKRLEGALAGVPRPAGEPPTEVSAAAISEEYRAAEKIVSERNGAAERLVAADVRLERAQEELDLAQAARTAAAFQLAALTEQTEGIDPDEILGRMKAVDETNAAARAYAEASARWMELDDFTRQVAEQSEKLDDIDQHKADSLAAADMPIDGLGFTDDGVTYRGVPMRQCSASERLRVGMAIAMKANPKIRVLRIEDASLLDADNLKLIEEMCGDQGYQAWIEVVGDGGVGFQISDGMVVDG
jgi:hypothetical protein